MKRIQTVLEDARHQVSTFNGGSAQLQAMKVINIMKTKRNSKKGAIKAMYQSTIDQLETEYNENF